MIWQLASRTYRPAREIADRHYNRQSVGHVNFMPPGRCSVFYAENGQGGRAVWGTSWPFAEYVMHRWAGAWVCSIFRNEGAGKASELIVDAVAATRAFFGDPPDIGMITFVDRSKVEPTMVRGREVWGWTFRKAGFRECGETKGGLLALQLLPSDMPPPQMAIGMQHDLLEVVA